MIDAINAASAALKANQEWLDGISSNVANINTPSYRARSVEFASAIAGVDGQPGAPLVTSVPGTPDDRVGDIRQTGRELDIAINGNGFLRLVDGDGHIQYTRLGRLLVNERGELCAANGLPLADDIIVPSATLSLAISTRGVVTARVAGEATPVQLGSLTLAHLADTATLTETGQGYYRDDSGNLAPLEGAPGSGVFGAIEQGHLEYSNVDLVNEMTQLVLAQRAYQLNARVLQIGDQALDTINNLRR